MLPSPTADPAAAKIKPNRDLNSPRCAAKGVSLKNGVRCSRWYRIQVTTCDFSSLKNALKGLGIVRQRGMLRRLRSRPSARVVKLVDTGDLKSPGHCGRAGSSPAPGTTLKTVKTVQSTRIGTLVGTTSGFGCAGRVKNTFLGQTLRNGIVSLITL